MAIPTQLQGPEPCAPSSRYAKNVPLPLMQISSDIPDPCTEIKSVPLGRFVGEEILPLEEDKLEGCSDWNYLEDN